MRNLLLVRHSDAKQNMNDDDFKRTISDIGIEDSKIIANFVLDKKRKPDIIISSDAVRAMETASIFAQSFGIDLQKINKEHFLYDNYTIEYFINFISTYSNDYKTIMIIGHNPLITQTGIVLSEKFNQNFPTTGCLSLTFNADDWKIEPRSGIIDFFEFPRKHR